MKRVLLAAAVCLFVAGMSCMLAVRSAWADAATPWRNESTGTVYADLSAAVAAAGNGDTITMTDAAVITSTVTVGKQITIDFGGRGSSGALNYCKSEVASGTETANTFNVTASGNLTLKNGILLGPCTTQIDAYSVFAQGARENSYNSITTHSRAVNALAGSSVTLNNMIVLQFATTMGNGAAVLVDNASLTVTNGSWLGASISKIGDFSGFVGNLARNGGAVYASGNSARVVIENGYVCCNISCDNTVTKGSDGTNPASSYNCGGGGVYLGTGVTAEISKNTFFYDRAYGYGGGIHICNAKEVVISGNTFQYEDCTDSFFLNNQRDGSGGSGGAIYSRFTDSLILKNNKISNSSINNGDREGGGIYILVRSDDAAELIGNEIFKCSASDQGGGVRLMLDGGTIAMENNNIHDCHSSRGGGLSVYNEGRGSSAGDGTNFNLISGKIQNNRATDFGGGIDYTHHDQQPLRLTNVLITDNTAARGGGIWACPTSETTMYATQGGAVYGNTAKGATKSITYGSMEAAGSEIQYEGTDSEDKYALTSNPATGTTQFTLVSRTLSGVLEKWYADETGDRYEKGDPEVSADDYRNRSTSFGLHGEVNETGQTLAANEAKLIISGNVVNSWSSSYKDYANTFTGRGGGIASNSPVIIGLNEDVTVKVEKKWSEDMSGSTAPDVYVDLYRIDAEGTEVKLDEHVKLSAENGTLTAIFTDLPASYADAGGDTQPYTYTVKEMDMDGWVLREMTTVYDESSRTYTVTLTNAKKAVSAVTYVSNGGSGSMTDARSPYAYGAVITVLQNAFSRAGYTFVSWNTKADGSGKAYAAGDKIEAAGEDIVLYAQWISAGSGDSGSKDAEIPQTGDAGRPVLWLALLTLAAVGILGSLACGKNQRCS